MEQTKTVLVCVKQFSSPIGSYVPGDIFGGVYEDKASKDIVAILLKDGFVRVYVENEADKKSDKKSK